MLQSRLRYHKPIRARGDKHQLISLFKHSQKAFWTNPVRLLFLIIIDSNVGFVFFVDATVGNSMIELFEQSI